MLNLSHKRLKAWKEAILLVSQIYEFTACLPKEELYGLTSQIKRAVTSIPANIAEGAARESPSEQKRFFEIARSSLVELDTHLEVAMQLGFVDTESTKDISDRMDLLFAMLTGLVKKNAKK